MMKAFSLGSVNIGATYARNSINCWLIFAWICTIFFCIFRLPHFYHEWTKVSNRDKTPMITSWTKNWSRLFVLYQILTFCLKNFLLLNHRFMILEWTLVEIINISFPFDYFNTFSIKICRGYYRLFAILFNAC